MVAGYGEDLPRIAAAKDTLLCFKKRKSTKTRGLIDTMSDAVKYLQSQHAHCDHAFLHAEDAVRRSDWAAAGALFSDARNALLVHIELEETVLFPAFEHATGVRNGPTAVMRDEHSRIRQMLDCCADKLSLHSADEFLAELDTLRVLIQQHNLKEETVLYPLCAARIDGLLQLLEAFVPAPA